MMTQNIIKLRKSRKLSQEALARKANISNITLAKIENDMIKDPRLSTLTKLADALEVSLDELVSRNFTHNK